MLIRSIVNWKQVFRKCRLPTDLDEIWQRSVVWKVGSVWFRSLHGQLQAKRNDMFSSVIPKCTITAVIYNGSPQSLWQTHKCVGSGLLCEKFGQFHSNVDGAGAKSGCFRYPAHSLQEQFYSKPVVPMESVHSNNVPFGSQPTKFQETHEKLLVLAIYFIHLIWCRKIRGIQRYNYFFLQIRAKWGSCRQKTDFGSYPGGGRILGRLELMLVINTSL